MLGAVHDDVLEEVAETGFDGPLVAAFDFKVVGNRTLLVHFAVRLRENRPRGVPVGSACRLELLERLQACIEPGEFLLAGAHRSGAPVVLNPCARQLGFACQPREPARFDRVQRAAKAVSGGGPICFSAFGLNANVAAFDVELGQRLEDPVACSGCVLNRMTQRGRGVDCREDLAPCRFHIRFEPFDLAMRELVRLRFVGEHLCSTITLGCRSGDRLAAVLERCSRGLPAGLDLIELRRHRGGPGGQRLHLIAVEGDLLLLPVDRKLARVRDLASPSSLRLGFGELDPHAAQMRIGFGDVCRRRRLPFARIAEPGSRRFNRLRQLPVLAREQHFLPAPQLVAQLLIPSRLGRLTLERSALLFNFEDDVVDAREVQLRGFQLQFGRTAARLVLRDPGRFLDQLTSIGRTRTENQPDFALLDDRVRLCAETGVHQQVVHVAQPALLAVDEVLAFAGAIQAARDFDLARDRLDQRFRGVTVQLPVKGCWDIGGRRGNRCHSRGRCRSAQRVRGHCHSRGDRFRSRGHCRSRAHGRWCVRSLLPARARREMQGR